MTHLFLVQSICSEVIEEVNSSIQMALFQYTDMFVKPKSLLPARSISHYSLETRYITSISHTLHI